ncbi:hypothetical protein QYE76_010305 [Lolium multiflorum]|uniref:Reverse transcriptase Ty1/copia-type domain-containing protein n=1 Tax=Lolium multiflorum TaxID=4521 RepID=A0AAD8TWP0_LOLMU|nr:hypothetical protein QYE76_010305 [Lolium multiflorum]
MHQPKNKNLPLVCQIKDKINLGFMMDPMSIHSIFSSPPNNVHDQAHDVEHSQEIEEAQVKGQAGDPNDQVDQVIPPRPRITKEEIEARRLARRDRNLEILEQTHEKVLSDVKGRVSTRRFEMSMMGEMRFFLGFEIKQLREGTFINQAKYLQDMLKRFKMMEMKGLATPMVTKCHLALDPNGKEVDQKTEGESKWGHEVATPQAARPGLAAPTYGVGLVPPLDLPFRLLIASVAKPPVESHDTENLPERRRESHLGDSGDPPAPCGEGIHLLEDSTPPWSPE